MLADTVSFAARLKSGLQLPLPGRQAQQLMAPAPRRYDPEPGTTPRQSAVLLPLYPVADTIHIMMIKRREYHNHHAGEIGFPGGAVEPQDCDNKATALRETDEELGIPTESVEVLGLLTPLYIEPSHNMVQPVVGWLNALPELKPQPSEVAQVLQTPLKHFMRGETLRWQNLQHNGQTLTFPCYMLGEDYVWGASAMILSELLSLVCDLEQDINE
ncbi:MAG: CoA pyrophosphatase [Anaerolineae bacterium]|nr:CoA pyrophosphatase [Anaerolineae bacterium]